MITTIGELKNNFKEKTEAEIEILWMYLNADEELRTIMKHVIKRLAEDPSCIDFTKNWQGSTEDLRVALTQI